MAWQREPCWIDHTFHPLDFLQVASAQQYNFSLRGYQPLLQWVEGHVGAMHSPPAAGAHQSLITNGGNHTLEVRRRRRAAASGACSHACQQARGACLLACLTSRQEPAASRVCHSRCPAPQMIMALFMDRGDSLLLEEYSYPVMTGGWVPGGPVGV